MAREQGRQWVDDLTVIQLRIDVSVIPNADEARRLFDALAVHAYEQINLHYKMQTTLPEPAPVVETTQ